MAPPQSVRPCKVADARTNPPHLIPATVTCDLPLARLADVERVWSPARDRVAAAMSEAGGHLESGHWDWRDKLWSSGSDGHRLFAIDCESDVQGLMALSNAFRRSVLSPADAVVYVDYLEVAPWNLKVPGFGPRFLGVGASLIAEAVRQSLAAGLEGRVGLHSLEQAERFYAERYLMTQVGTDPTYHDLVYFEFRAGEAARWLADRRQ